MNTKKAILLVLVILAPTVTTRAGQPTIRLPEAVSSFGAAVSGGKLYVYGGHRGEAHAHSRDNLAPRFVRIDLAAPSEWESLPMETPLQGTALVGDGRYLYRVGGMTARNADDEDDDLHSVAEFSRFDPASNQWTALVPLPEPRSSHDAIVLDCHLYVVGGWMLEGEGHGHWYETAWSIDLANAAASWQPLSAPPFRQRALAVAAWTGRVWAMGGMTDTGEVTRAVYSYDPHTKSWSRHADIPGDGMQGFGASAWGHATGLYVAGSDGLLYRLTDADGQWQVAGRLQEPRFFHRLLPAGERTLVAVAGASHRVGHLADVERLPLGE